MKGKKWLFRPIIFILVIALIIPALVASCGGDDTPTGPGEETTVTVTVTDTGPTLAPGEVIELTVANYFPAPTSQAKVLGEFCVELEERTGGRVQVDYYDSSTLLGPTDMFQGVIDGVADIGYSHVYYTSGRMPVTECAGLPLGYPSGWVGGHVLNDFYDEFKPAEWDEVVVLWLNTSTPSNITTRDKAVRTLEDLEGLTLRAPGLAGEVISALGATPVGTPMPETNEAIAKGEIDGESSNFETLFAFKFAEVCDYTTSIWQITFPYPFYLVMNKDSYNSLPADIKEIFDTLVGEYKERYILMWNSVDYLGKEAGEANGVEFIYLSEAEAAKFQAAVEPVIDDYIAKMVDAGYSQAEVEGWIQFLRERIEYWTEKQVTWHIQSAAGPPEVTQ